MNFGKTLKNMSFNLSAKTNLINRLSKIALIAALSVGLHGVAANEVKAQLNSGAQQNVIGEAGNFLIRNARIVTVSGATIENGFISIRNGKIEQIGSGKIEAGRDVKVVEGTGLSVYPGMIDASTNLGLTEIPLGAPGTDDDGEVGDFNPNAKAIIAVNPHNAHINVTRNNGITTVLTMPKDGLIAGQSAIINLVGSTAPEMSVEPTNALVVNFPRISTFAGFNPFGSQPPVDFAEATRRRDRQLEDLRKMFRDAEAYGKAMDAKRADTSLPRSNEDIKMMSLVPYVRGEKPVLFVAERERDIRAAVKFADEMKMKMILLGGSEAVQAADVLKQKDIPVIFTNIFSLPVNEDDAYDKLFATAAKLREAGVRFCISTGDDGANIRDLPYQAGMTAAYGLPQEDALKSVTLYPAQILGIADRVGSLETGKIANVVITDGDILQPTTKILHLFIKGRKIPLTSRHTELYEQFKDRR